VARRVRGKRGPNSIWIIALGVAAVCVGIAAMVAFRGSGGEGLALEPIEDRVVDELSLLEFNIQVQNADQIRGHIEYALVDAPEGSKIDPKTGRFSWRPAEEQGPEWYEITVRVTGPDKASEERTFGVHVCEVNQPPTLQPIANKTIDINETLAFDVAVADPDVPAQPIRFRLGPGAPAGAQIDKTTGRFQWKPQEGRPGEVHQITVQAGKPGQAPTAEQTFAVRIHEPQPTETGDPGWTVERLLLELRSSGARAAESAEPFEHPPLSGDRQGLSVDGQQLGVFAYTSPQAASADVARLTADDLKVFAESQSPPCGAYLFCRDRLLAFYVGPDPSMVNLLRQKLGQPLLARTVAAMPVVQEAEPQDGRAEEGDEIILKLFRANKLLSKSEYPTLRRIYAGRFESQHQEEIKQVFGDDAGEMRRWLEDHTEIKEEFYLAINPEHDDVVRALQLFRTLKEEFPDSFQDYANLAIAVSVVWDKEQGAIHGSPRGQHKSLQPEGELGALENFKYCVDAEAFMQGRAQFLPWEFLVFLVNHRTTLAERQWALASYLPKRAMIGKCYGDVPYDGEMLEGLPPRLEGKPHTLPNIRGFGGVCSCQADYAARVAKSIGVPAFRAGAQNKYGGSHAWVMWVELGAVTRTGFTFSLESHGRYRGDKYYVGNVADPHTGQRTTDRDVELRLHTAGMDPIAKRQAELVMRSYPMLRERVDMDTAEQLIFLGRVVQLCPGNEAAWYGLADMSRNGQITKANSKPMMQILNRLFNTFAKMPDFTWKVFDDMVAFQDLPRQRAVLFGRLAAMYEQAERPDLSCEARLKFTEYLVADDRYEEAIEALSLAILMFPDEGRYIPRMLDKLDELGAHVEGVQQHVIRLYQQLLPKIPQKRGDRPSQYCMQMYEKGIALFRQTGLLALAQAYEVQLQTLKAAEGG
jgi:hypothetical protein